MKRKILAAALLTVFLTLLLAGCGGNVRHVAVEPWESELYSEKDVEDAISVVKSYFQKEFSGCTLTSITYAGDEKTEAEARYAAKNNADEVMVLTSSFDVDQSGGNGSLNPNSTYQHFMWFLVRKDGGPWQHLDHGY